MSASTKRQILNEYHGYAAADLEEGSRTLLVYCEELLPFLKGELKATEVDAEIKTKNGSEEYSSKIKISNVITCEYKDDASTNAFPPLVRRGEQIVLFNQGDSDYWYWKSEARNDNSRRLDTKRIHISATLENAPELNEDNTYFVELDTRKFKRIRISTSKADGEDHRYLLELNPEKSTIFLGDDYGNQIFMDSNHPRVCMKNKDNSLIDLNTKNIIIACENDISIMAKKGNVLITADKDITQKSGKKTHHTSGDDMIHESGKNLFHTAAQSWTLSYKTGGTTNGSGSTLIMRTQHLQIEK